MHPSETPEIPAIHAPERPETEYEVVKTAEPHCERPESALAGFSGECGGFAGESEGLLGETERSVDLPPDVVGRIRNEMNIGNKLDGLNEDVGSLGRGFKASLFAAFRSMGQPARFGLKALSVANMLAGAPAMAVERPVASPVETVVSDLMAENDMIVTAISPEGIGTERDLAMKRKELRQASREQSFESFCNSVRYPDGSVHFDSGTLETPQGGRITFPGIEELKRSERIFMEHSHPQNMYLGYERNQGGAGMTEMVSHADHVPPSVPDVRTAVMQALYYRTQGATGRDIGKVSYGVFDAGGTWTYSLDSDHPMCGKRLDAEHDIQRLDDGLSLTEAEQGLLNEDGVSADILLRFGDGRIEDDRLLPIREKLVKRAAAEEVIMKRHFSEEELGLIRESEALSQAIADDGATIIPSREISDRVATTATPEKAVRDAEHIRKLCELYGKQGIRMEYLPYHQQTLGQARP